MTDDMIALARRAVACKGWRWIPGMLDHSTRRVLDVNTGCNAGVPVWWTDALTCDVVEMYERPEKAKKEWSDALPDLTDPATLGCLLALVRSVYTDPRLAVVPWRRQWAVDRVWLRDGRLSTAPTEAEALVAALEVAPDRGEHRRKEE